MAYFENDELFGLDLDLYLADEQGRIGCFSTSGYNIYHALLSKTVDSILEFYFHNLREKRRGYTVPKATDVLSVASSYPAI